MLVVRNSIRSFIFVAVLGSFGAFASRAHAQSINLPPGDLFKVTVNSQQFSCGRVSGRWVPGALKGASSFTPFAVSLKDMQRKLKSASAAQKPKIQKKLAALKSKNAKAKGPCAAGPGIVPTPGSGTPTPRPTPRPTAPQGCFNGSLTSCFGIPPGLQGDVNRGQSAWLSGGCQGCHSEMSKRGLSFSRVQGSFSTEPTMRGLALPSSQSLADITAYLNRFN